MLFLVRNGQRQKERLNKHARCLESSFFRGTDIWKEYAIWERSFVGINR